MDIHISFDKMKPKEKVIKYLKSNRVYFPFFSFLIILGLLLFFYPNFIVPKRVVQNSNFFLINNKSVLVVFTTSSTGAFTAGDPINVGVEIVGTGVSEVFQDPSDIWLSIHSSYKYPIEKVDLVSTGGGFFREGYIPISVEDGKGKGMGAIVFPYPGTYSDYSVTQHRVPLIVNSNGSPIFKIEDYSVRLQIENANRNLGIGIMALSVAMMGLIYSITKKKIST